MRNHSITLAALFFLLLSAPIGVHGDVPPEPASKEMRSVMRAQLDLGVKLVHAYNNDANVCVSPYSIHAALTQVRLGAKGATAQELDSVLFPDGYSFGVLQGYAMLNRTLVQQHEGLKVGLANSVWVEKRTQLLASFMKSTKSFFDSEPGTFDGSKPEESAERINRWVASNTADRIQNLLSSDAIGPDLVAVLVNALYFKGSWVKPFKQDATIQAPFWLSASKSIDVPMMRDTQTLAYFEDEQWKAVAMPFTGGLFEYLVMVPKRKLTAEEVARQLESKAIVRCIEGLSSQRVEFSMPRHELRYKRNLVDELSRLGLSRALSGEADYSGMATERVSVGRVLHESFIKVDEYGAEGAAATAALMERMAAFTATPKVLAADRPFVFAIIHRESSAPLFLGVLGEPKV